MCKYARGCKLLAIINFSYSFSRSYCVKLDIFVLREHLSVSPKRTQSTGSPPLEDRCRGRGLPWRARHPRPGCSPVCLRASTVSWRCSSPRSPTPGRGICHSPPARWATGAVCRCRCWRSLRNPSPRSSLRTFSVAPQRHKCESIFSKTVQSLALPGFPTQTQILTETLFKSDQFHLTCETRNRPSFEINQPPRVLIMTVGPFKSWQPTAPRGRRQSRWCSAWKHLRPPPPAAPARLCAAAADLQEETGETLPASAHACLTHPHTWKAWRGDKNTSLKWLIFYEMQLRSGSKSHSRV